MIQVQIACQMVSIYEKSTKSLLFMIILSERLIIDVINLKVNSNKLN